MGNKYIPGGFYWKRELYQSDAFLSLGKNSIKIVIALLDNRNRERPSEAKDKKGNKRKPKFTNLDRLEIPYGTLEKKYKIGHSSIPSAIDELLAKGFIEISYHGGRYKHDKSRYSWSDNYLLWNKDTEPFAVRPRGEKRGYQGKMLGAVKKNKHRKTSPYTHRKTSSKGVT